MQQVCCCRPSVHSRIMRMMRDSWQAGALLLLMHVMEDTEG